MNDEFRSQRQLEAFDSLSTWYQRATDTNDSSDVPIQMHGL